jgi:hypothetical protein
MQGGDINLYVSCYQVIDNPYKVVAYQDEAQPAVDINSGFKREQIQFVPHFYLGTCDD